MSLTLNGTKERIFDTAVHLIAKNGFEKVSMRDIAGGTGIQAASIYNHFSSKEEILETIYQYFRENRTENRRSVEHIRETIQTGSALDIVTVLSDTAFAFEEKVTVRMVLIPKIILTRIYDDPRANAFFKQEWFVTDIAFLRQWLQYAVEIGRLAKDFDIESFSMFFWRQLIMMAVWAFADPDYEVRTLDEEKLLLKMYAAILPLKDPQKESEQG